MSEKYISCAVDQHQQQGGMPLKDFAVLEGLTKSQALQLVKRGHVLGAQQTHGGRWLVFPPAKLLHRPRRYNRESGHYDSLQTGEDAAALAFDVGTSPHGLSADCLQTVQESHSPIPSHSLADQQAEGAQAFCPEGNQLHGEANGIAGAAQAAPNAEASNMPKLLPYHYLELTDCEFLHLLSAVERDRIVMRQAIQKGLAVEADMDGIATLWEKLQEVRAIREFREYGG